MPLAIGALVCVHSSYGGDPWIARVVDLVQDEDGYWKYDVCPIWLSHSKTRIHYWGDLEPVLATFEGPICIHCKKGSVQ